MQLNEKLGAYDVMHTTIKRNVVLQKTINYKEIDNLLYELNDFLNEKSAIYFLLYHHTSHVRATLFELFLRTQTHV